jgi:hypothetical protein
VLRQFDNNVPYQASDADLAEETGFHHFIEFGGVRVAQVVEGIGSHYLTVGSEVAHLN